MTKIVTLTGGIGSGKTTVEKIFSDLGVETIDADRISSDLIKKNTKTHKNIIKSFSNSILTDENEIDRLKMRKIIFSNVNAKKKLEDILHPEIQAIIEQKVKQSMGPYVLQVIPLWVENYGANRPGRIWKVIVVEAPIQTRRSRTIFRSKADMKTFDLVIQNQASDDERRKIADDVIVNEGTIRDLVKQVKSIHEGYINFLTKT